MFEGFFRQNDRLVGDDLQLHKAEKADSLSEGNSCLLIKPSYTRSICRYEAVKDVNGSRCDCGYDE